MANMPARRAWSWLSSVACNFTLRVAWSTAGLIALSVPLNSRPGIASVVTRDRQVACDFPKILLRQGEIDEDRDRAFAAKRADRPAAHHLPGIDRADARHAIEWRVDFLLVDYRLHVIDHRFFLPVFRFGRVELGFRDYLAIREIARPIRVGLGQLRVSLRGTQLRHFRGSVELQKEIAFLDRLARFEIDLAHHARRISALIMAPCTGEMEPTAVKIGCQSACLTIALVTVVGGGTIFLPAETMVKICNP